MINDEQTRAPKTAAEIIANQLEYALLLATPGARHFDDNLGLTVSSDRYRDLTVKHDSGRNGDNDMRFIALCSPENIKGLLDERRALLAAHEPVSFDALRAAVFEMTGGRPTEWNSSTYKGHQVMPFINFNSLLRIVDKFRTHPAPSIPDVREAVRQAHAEWSEATFGNVGPVGPLKHLAKEAIEAANEPGDLSEWADCQFLLWDAQRRAGITDEQIAAACVEKLAVNKARIWPEPKDGEPRLHVKGGAE